MKVLLASMIAISAATTAEAQLGGVAQDATDLQEARQAALESRIGRDGSPVGLTRDLTGTDRFGTRSRLDQIRADRERRAARRARAAVRENPVSENPVHGSDVGDAAPQPVDAPPVGAPSFEAPSMDAPSVDTPTADRVRRAENAAERVTERRRPAARDRAEAGVSTARRQAERIEVRDLPAPAVQPSRPAVRADQIRETAAELEAAASIDAEATEAVELPAPRVAVRSQTAGRPAPRPVYRDVDRVSVHHRVETREAPPQAAPARRSAADTRLAGSSLSVSGDQGEGGFHVLPLLIGAFLTLILLLTARRFERRA